MTFDTPAITHHRVRLARVLSGIGVGIALLSVLVGAFTAVTDATIMLGKIAVALFGLWIAPLLASYVVWFLRGSRPGRVTVDAEGLELSTVARIPRAEIASSYVIVRPTGTFVEVVRTNGDVFAVNVPDEAHGAALVATLGFATGGKRQTIDLGARSRRMLHLGLGLAAYQAASFASMPFLLFLGAQYFYLSFVWLVVAAPILYGLFKRWMRAPVLEIGDDGLSITRGTRRTFHPRWSIQDVKPKPGTTSVAVVTNGGGFLVSGALLDGDRSQAAVAALRSRWAAPVPSPARVASFLREGRDVGAWQAELRVRIATGGYRDGGSVSVEDAAAVLASPAAPTDARLGAAFALAAAGERVRIAEAAAPITDLALRETLEAIADGHEEPKKLAMLLQR